VDLARSQGFWGDVQPAFGSNQVPPVICSPPTDRSPVMNEEQSEAGTITFLDDLRWLWTLWINTYEYHN
jgi:hypothetical protein